MNKTIANKIRFGFKKTKMATLQRTYWRYHWSVTYVAQQPWRGYHEKFSFIVTKLTSQSSVNASQNESK